MSGGRAQGPTGAVPPEFLEMLEVPERGSVGAFVESAQDAMRAALALPPDGREAAFTLLAADAYLTWACASVVDSGGGSNRIRRVLDDFLAVFTESGP